ncbi:MAG: hypothetical protein D9V47_10175 [Clostridia bacterium]|nr:MAG: hypothetical protein D9V47_10175 [Clostridia bacterium]
MLRLRTFWLGLVVVGVLLAAGCGDSLDKVKSDLGGQAPAGSEGTQGQSPGAMPEASGSGAGLPGQVPGDMVTVKLYFSDPSGQYLAEEKRTIPKVEGIGRTTVEELIAGPSPESGLLPTIPVGTVLRDINVRPDGLAIVDFSRDLVNNFVGGSESERLVVYSIVNTLTQFPTVHRVRILVEGQEVDTLAGHVETSAALAPAPDLVMKGK